MLAVSDYPALLLNADYRPMSVSPLSTLPWQEAIKDLVLGKYTPVAEYDREVRSQSVTMRLPSVLAAKQHVNMSRPASFTRWNVMMFYDFSCLFCGKQFPTDQLTYEHLIPKSRNGARTWGNIVPACVPCNARKGNRTPEEARMPLLRKPCHPTLAQLNRIGEKYAPRRRDTHKTWSDFIYWDGDLL